MRGRRRASVVSWTVALIAPLLAGVARAGAPAARFTGAFLGTGRACYGRLDVRTRTLSWLTPFSQCQQVPYRVIEEQVRGNERRIAFRLAVKPKGCRYGVLALHHRDDPDPDVAWEVVGYATLADYRADAARGFKAELPTTLSCYLVTNR